MTTVLRFGEPVIDAMVCRLRDNLPHVIDQINAADTKDIQLEYVDRDNVLDFIPVVTELVNFPTIGISESPVGLTDDVGWGATGVIPLTVVAFAVEADQRRLAVKLRRYASAVASVVLEGRQMLPEVWGITLTSIDPGPTLGRREDPRSWMSYVAVSVECKTEEDAL